MYIYLSTDSFSYLDSDESYLYSSRYESNYSSLNNIILVNLSILRR